MHIVFKKVDEWFEKDPDLKRKFQDTYRMIYASAHKYAEHMEEVVKEKTNTSIKVEIMMIDLYGLYNLSEKGDTPIVTKIAVKRSVSICRRLRKTRTILTQRT